MKITYVFLFISIVTLSAISQTNTLSRIVMSNTVNGVNDRAIVFHPDSNRLLMMLGGIVNPSANSYDVQMFMPGAGRWINFLPDSALYGVWADSTGYSRGQGVISGGFSWATVYQNGKSYLRPMLQHNVQSHIYNQYAYDSDSQKIYFYMSNYTFTYNCRTRLWDTLKTAVHPNQLSTALALQAGKNGVYWGALCYDPVNREVLYFGGGNSPAQNGHNGTWVFSTETKAWRQLTGAEPPPRCLSPMVYDPASKCIVLFGGDHFDYLTSDTWLYHCTTRTWERVTPAISPAPRAGHSMMYLPKSKTIAMLGGYDYDTGYGTYSYRRQLELWKYNVTGNSWVLIKQWPGIFNPQLRYKGPTLAAADADDNIYIVAEDTARYSSTPNFKTWRIDADGSVSDVNGTAALGVAAGKVTRRPYGFDPAWYSTSVPATDTAVSEASLRNMTPNVWINIKPPKKHTWTTFSDIVWGAIRFSPDHDVIMSFNGGHSSYSANQVHTYLPNQNRWKVGYSGENPINFEGASGYFPSHHSFDNRPFMVNHLWASYNYSHHLRRLVLVKPRFTYTYDPSRMDWDSLRISNHSEQGGGAQGTQIIETDSGVVCWSDSKLFRLNYNSRIWEKLNTTGVAVPAVVVDRDGAVYEPKRNRILFFKYASPVSVQSYNLETEILTNVTTVNSAVAVINNNNFREVVYLPDQDILFFGGKNSGAHLIYDCSSERFDTVRIEPSTLFTGGYSTGLMYDAKRKIIWQVDQKLEINAMRPQNLMTLLEKQKAGCSFKPFLRAIPNPFNPSSNLSFSLPIEKSGILEVFNAYGVLIRKLYEGQLGAGNHQIEWNGRDDFGRKVSAGLYVVRLTLGKESLNTRIIFAK